MADGVGRCSSTGTCGNMTNVVAAWARADGHNGVIYPSVRHTSGTCVAALWPHVVQSVVQGAMVRLTWSGDPEYVWEPI